MQADFLTLDVFTDRRFGGNPLAVFPDAEHIPPELMQPIAREFNLSETVFILPAEDKGDFRLRIFTPFAELPFAGHPTVGAALALRAHGRVQDRVMFEEGAGLIPVSVTVAGKATLTSAHFPERAAQEIPPEALAEVLGIAADTVRGSGIWGAGNNFYLAELPDRAGVAAAGLNLSAWRTHMTGLPVTGLFFFTRYTEDPQTDIHARMFAPDLGVPEDPATGSAVTALGGYLGPGTYRVAQGVEMGRPSLLHLTVDDLAHVGGTAVHVSAGTMTLA